jgi:hypothetical protein
VEITADLDFSALLRHLDAIERQTEELRAALPVEFADWQEHDMNRRFASTRSLDIERPASNFTRASTVVWPTSRRRVKARSRLVRRRRKKGVQPERVMLSRRPALRRQLIERFHARFRDLLDRSF